MDAALRERLTKLIAMVGSDHDGEVINAVRAADRLLRQHKLTWHDFLLPNGGSPLVTVLQSELASARRENQQLRAQLAARPSPFEQPDGNHAAQAQWALDLGLALNDFECGFLESIAARPWPLTERQQPVFARIMAKVQRMSGRTPP